LVWLNNKKLIKGRRTDNNKKMKTIKHKIAGMKTIYAKGQYWDWNPTYKVYNSRKDYSQLNLSDLKIRSKKRRKK